MEQIYMKVLNSIFNLFGNAIQYSFSGKDLSKQEENMRNYHDRLAIIERDREKEPTPPTVDIETTLKQNLKPMLVKKLKEQSIMEEIQEQKERDLTEAKIKGGTACLPCSRDHFTTASAMLKESLRFAKRPEHGMTSDEVMRRIGIALEELNAMERGDLDPESTKGLEGREKELADWALNNSGRLRHQITSAKTVEQLEEVAAEASKIKTEFMKNVWNLATTDGTIEKLCKGLNGEEKKVCIQKISMLLK